MSKINVGRLVLGGVVAGVLLFITDGILHGMILKSDWAATMAAVGRPIVEGADQGQKGMPAFVVYDLLKGLIAIWIYVAMRSRFGAGAKTAVMAGLTAWSLVNLTSFIGLMPMEFFSMKMVATWCAFTAVSTTIAAVAGAALYKEDATG